NARPSRFAHYGRESAYGRPERTVSLRQLVIFCLLQKSAEVGDRLIAAAKNQNDVAVGTKIFPKPFGRSQRTRCSGLGKDFEAFGYQHDRLNRFCVWYHRHALEIFPY